MDRHGDSGDTQHIYTYVSHAHPCIYIYIIIHMYIPDIYNPCLPNNIVSGLVLYAVLCE